VENPSLGLWWEGLGLLKFEANEAVGTAGSNITAEIEAFRKG
jgi:hypothetical protein